MQERQVAKQRGGQQAILWPLWVPFTPLSVTLYTNTLPLRLHHT